METQHTPIFADASQMAALPDDSVDLVVTSPPYPMIDMWDALFRSQLPAVAKALDQADGRRAFEGMHRKLDRIWTECYRVLKPGRFACINIGDATRTLGGEFALYPNHSRIISAALRLGFQCLPAVIWRKQTNAPNKFMGSGMLPAGAYVTLEHEYILILRKGGKRVFTTEAQRQLRRESALFWEERNQWFSDVWMDLKGSRQALADPATRKRSAAYPFELAHRLIAMYSMKSDLVLDPFLGLGTTMAAAMALGRNSTGYEIDSNLAPAIADTARAAIPLGQKSVTARLKHHKKFIADRLAAGKPVKHHNAHYDFPVITAQEKALCLARPLALISESSQPKPMEFRVRYDTEISA